MRTPLISLLVAITPLVTAGLTGCGSSPTPDENGTAGGGQETTSAGSGATAAVGSGGGPSATTGSGAAPPDFAGYARVDNGGGSAVSGGADIAISPSGTIYVSWVTEQDGRRDVVVARSVDGGQTFGSALKLDDDTIEPLVSMARHPYVAADDARVAVVFNDDAGTVRLYLSAATEPMAFGEAIVIGGDIATDFRDFPKARFLDDGSVVVAWHGYPASGARIFVSREKASFASEEASGGAPGVPCECCPLDLFQTTSGDVEVAFRNNDGNIREMWVATAARGGSFSSFLPISSSEGTVDNCPMQGPRLAQAASGDRLAVWSNRGSQAGAVYFAGSADGTAWSGGAPVGGFIADEPTIATLPSGRIFVTGVTGNARSSITWTDDGGGSWTAAEPLQTPDGDLGVPQAENGADIAALAAVSSAGTVWLRRMQ
jgi:hypothetical protein